MIIASEHSFEKRIWLAAAVVLCSAGLGFGQAVTVPNGLSGTEGNSVGNYPFDGLGTSSRYQQVFDASQFSGLRNAGGYINSMALRLNGSCQGASGQTVSNLQINLSTTARGPDSLSTMFAENIGTNDTIVLGPGRFSILGGCSVGSSPQNFTMFIHFDISFFYNPNAGNLLMDIRNYSGSPDDGSLFQLDGHNEVGDSISSIFAFNVDIPFANQVTSFGYATYFTYVPVPRLSISRQTNSVLLRWAYEPFGFAVEQAAVLGPSASWHPAGGTILVNQGYKEVTFPLDTQATARFFRLVLPSLPAARPSASTMTGPIVVESPPNQRHL